jgi:hypothetical protein
MIHWFGYFKKQNQITFTSVDFNLVAPFLRGRDFCIEELLVVEDDEEISLLNPNEELTWITSDHYIEIKHLLEITENKWINNAVIKFKDGGQLVFNTGQLAVKYSKNESLKEVTIHFLISLGYFAAEELWEFSEQNPSEHLLSFVLAMEPEAITDEFERMRVHTQEIKKSLS